MSVGGRFVDITRDDLLALADRFEVAGAREVLADVVAAVDPWPELAAEVGVPGDEIARIAREHAAVRSLLV